MDERFFKGVTYFCNQLSKPQCVILEHIKFERKGVKKLKYVHKLFKVVM